MAANLAFWAEYQKKKEERMERRVREEAEYTYQVSERGGVLWINYNRVPIVPETVLKDDIRDVVRVLREGYIKDKTRRMR